MLDGIGGTGILSTMKYVNIDQQLPRIGIRQQQAMGLKTAMFQQKCTGIMSLLWLIWALVW